MVPDRFQFERPTLPRPREYAARVSHLRWLTPETLEVGFDIEADEPFSFVPGQYVSLILEADEELGLRKELRPYSLWNHPDEEAEGEVVTVVRMVDKGRATTWLRQAEVDAPLRLVGPLGSFFLRRPLHPHLFFVATGTGLVPLRNMLRAMEKTGELDDRETTLLFGVRHRQDLFGVEELAAWTELHPRFRFVPTLSQPDPDWTGATGRVTDHLRGLDFLVEDMQIYLCGNGAMVDEVVDMMEARGLDRRTRRIIYEKYFD